MTHSSPAYDVDWFACCVCVCVCVCVEKAWAVTACMHTQLRRPSKCTGYNAYQRDLALCGDRSVELQRHERGHVVQHYGIQIRDQRLLSTL